MWLLQRPVYIKDSYPKYQESIMKNNSTTINIKNSSITIEISDITLSNSDCIVNAANRTLLGGGGVDGAIHRAAGPALLAECRTLNGCKTGEAKITKGYNLNAKFIIHTAGPIYRYAENPEQDLINCYRNSLDLAKEFDIHSIDFPAISCGAYGYPINDAAKVAYKTISEWIEANESYPINVTLSCFNEEVYESYLNI